MELDRNITNAMAFILLIVIWMHRVIDETRALLWAFTASVVQNNNKTTFFARPKFNCVYYLMFQSFDYGKRLSLPYKHVHTSLFA